MFDLKSKQRNGIKFIVFFLSLILTIYFFASHKPLLTGFFLIIIIALLICNRDFFKKILFSSLEELGDLSRLKKHIVELIILAVIVGILIWLLSYILLPSQDIAVSCEGFDKPTFNIKMQNPNREGIENFVFFIHDNWINDINLSTRLGVIYMPEDYGIYFPGVSKWFCNATNIAYDELYREDCPLLDCPYKTKELFIENYAIRIDCDYIPPDSTMEFDVNLFQIGKDGIRKEINFEKEGFIEVSYFGPDHKYVRKIISCKNYIFPFLTYHSGDQYDPEADYYIFFSNKFGFYLKDAIPYFILLIVVVIGVILIIKEYVYKKS